MPALKIRDNFPDGVAGAAAATRAGSLTSRVLIIQNLNCVYPVGTRAHFLSTVEFIKEKLKNKISNSPRLAVLLHIPNHHKE